MNKPLLDALDAMRLVADDLERAAGRLRSSISLITALAGSDDRIYLRYMDNVPNNLAGATYELDAAFTIEDDEGWTSKRWRRLGAADWITRTGHWPHRLTERIDHP